ncbi:MAG: hypothetical protein ISP41_12130 [Alphaproteobacteria bacterium]|nr:hypothetical protein [Alphaproteobacteria bacterium]
MLAFWEAKRAGRSMPRRTDFVAEELREWIGWLHLLRPVPDGDDLDFIYEVFSTRSSIGAHYEMTGRRVGEWDDDRVAVALEFYRAVMREKSPVTFAAPERFEKDFIAFRRIALPFGDETGITHILAHLSELPIAGAGHREPVRLDLETIQIVLRGA